MSQYDYSKEKRRRRAFKRVRGVILLLLVLGLLVWGVTAFIQPRSSTKQPAYYLPGGQTGRHPTGRAAAARPGRPR